MDTVKLEGERIALIEKVIKRVFGGQVTMPPDAFLKKYLKDMPKPTKVTSVLSGDTFATSMQGQKVYAARDEVLEESNKHDWLWPKEEITSLEKLNKLLERFDFMQANRVYDSENVYNSDDVVESQHVYESVNVIRSKNISDCHWIWDGEFLVACERSGESTFCIGLTEGVQCADSYRIFSSHKVTRSMFIKSCYDLQDCMFCAHISGKQYCIANMQYTKAEYEKLKAQILEWLF